MKKINLKGISEVLSEKELKNVKGGSSQCNTGCSSGEYCVPTGSSSATRCSLNAQAQCGCW